jgi:hypothetical protein
MPQPAHPSAVRALQALARAHQMTSTFFASKTSLLLHQLNSSRKDPCHHPIPQSIHLLALSRCLAKPNLDSSQCFCENDLHDS